MKTVYILNPAAGQGKAVQYADRENVYITREKGDAVRFARELLCDAAEGVHFVACGGDGTVSEVAEGIIASGSDMASISIIPTGTGNDLVRTLGEQESGEVTCDVLTVNGKIAVNEINTGFDLDVVSKAERFKSLPLVSGSMAYILGVVSTLLGRFGKHMRIDYIDKNGDDGFFEGDCLLAVAANGRYYGGGFKASPAADISDGLIDLTVVRKISRLKFISMVLKYKKGLHIDIENEKPAPEFEDIILFKKCRSVRMNGICGICYDGQITQTKCADIGIIPGAVNILKSESCVRV